MYSTINFKTKAEFKRAVLAGVKVTLFSPGIGTPTTDGKECVEGPHYPEPHRWYAEVTVENGVVTSIK